MSQGKSRTAEIVTAISTAIIAVLALFVSIWQGCETRKHNRLSVKPHLLLITHLDINEPIYGIIVKNTGAGPAFITGFELFIDGKPCTGKICGWDTLLKTFNMFGPGASWIKYGCLNPETTSLAPGDVEELLAVKKDNYTKERIDQLFYAISRLDIKITYMSLYEEQFQVNFKKAFHKSSHRFKKKE